MSDKKGAKELFKALIPLKIKWVSQASMDMLYDKELIDLMLKSGGMGNVIGFESILDEVITGNSYVLAECGYLTRASWGGRTSRS